MTRLRHHFREEDSGQVVNILDNILLGGVCVFVSAKYTKAR